MLKEPMRHRPAAGSAGAVIKHHRQEMEDSRLLYAAVRPGSHGFRAAACDSGSARMGHHTPLSEHLYCFCPLRPSENWLCLTDTELLAIMTKNDERKGHCELCVLASMTVMACAIPAPAQTGR